MSRRSPGRTDSLEMLLDTMCNTFGVIILISLMIALLSREPAPPSVETTSTTQSDPLVESHREAVRIQGQLAMKRKDVDPTLRLLSEIQTLRERIARAVADRDRGQREQLKAEADFEAANRTNQHLRQVQGKLRELISRVQEESAAVSNRRAVEINPPLYRSEKATGGQPARERWDVIVRHDSLFPISHQLPNGTAPNKTSIEWKPIANSTVDFTLNPIQGLGIDFARDPSGLDRLLASLSPGRIVLHFFLYEDSFKLFPALRKAVVDRGFGYDVEFIPDTGVITTGSSPGSQEVGSLTGGPNSP